jgi:short-subunit dehydrogenase involved in D-alanine esterification of teichoic acids
MDIKKIAITGHTKGIGKSLLSRLSETYDVIGFSRTNGYDISKETDILRIIDESRDCDIFINNAYEKNYQTILFKLIFDKWKFLPKTIINMNSSCVYHSSDWSPEYADNKKELKEVVLNTIGKYKNKKVRVINLYPSTLSTHKGFESLNKLDTENLAKMINWLIKQPQEIEIREMSIYCTTLEKEFKINKLI